MHLDIVSTKIFNKSYAFHTQALDAYG